jgi:HNH endonuclease
LDALPFPLPVQLVMVVPEAAIVADGEGARMLWVGDRSTRLTCPPDGSLLQMNEPKARWKHALGSNQRRDRSALMAKPSLISIPIPFLRECFIYDPVTGVLRWRARPESHFPSAAIHKMWNAQHAGKETGCQTSRGALIVGLKYEGIAHQFFVHRIALAMLNDRWPPYEVDHRHHDPANNRFAELREATPSQNQQNRKGVRGTHQISNGRWRSVIYAPKKIHLGYFDTEAEAHAAYLEAKRKYHPFASHGL